MIHSAIVIKLLNFIDILLYLLYWPYFRQFTVPSVNFPGQTHVWKLNPIFQKGIETAREEYLDGLSFALRFLVVYAPHLIIGENHSLRRALHSLKQDLIEFFGTKLSPILCDFMKTQIVHKIIVLVLTNNNIADSLSLILYLLVLYWISILCFPPDLIFGFGKVYVPNLERRIQEERCKFLVAELKCKVRDLFWLKTSLPYWEFICCKM
jgi:hypothetical protein